ncbi:MAG: AAA family ATPase [Anaerosomatales bacterium]|nr:AAA family ATPase [Anaerosomatales bacterium]
MSMTVHIPEYRRPYARTLLDRLREPRRYIQVISGPRQVGKTTLVRQALVDSGLPYVFVSADEPTLRDSAWLSVQWERARIDARRDGRAVLAVDEVHKITGWSETVKRLWDEDASEGLPLHVVLLGSAPVVIGHGLSESLAGRFEVIRIPHWSYGEMADSFGFDLDAYIYFGAYPGAAALISDESRWRAYVLDSLIETAISRDVLLLQRIEKPALLRRLFELGCAYSGQVLSYTKMLGQLQDAGNTVTLAHYLHLLAGAGLLCGLSKHSGDIARKRGSSPKLQVFNTALISAVEGRSFASVRSDGEAWGRRVESVVGAHLVNLAYLGLLEVLWWRDGNDEVDFVVRDGDRRLVAIEVKSGMARPRRSGLDAFLKRFPGSRALIVGGVDGIPLAEFLQAGVVEWLG